jgi:hypothetical protein
MLAVIQDKERAAVCQESCERFERESPGLLPYSQCGGKLAHDKCWVGERRKLDEPDALHVVRHHARGHFQGESRLTHATGASECQEARSAEQVLELNDLRATTYETGELSR